MDFWNDLRQHFLADQLGCKYKLIEQTKGLLRIAFSHSDWWVTWMEQILQPTHFDMPCDIQSVTGACSWGANTGGKNEQRKVQLAIFQNGSGCLKAKGCSKLETILVQKYGLRDGHGKWTPPAQKHFETPKLSTRHQPLWRPSSVLILWVPARARLNVALHLRQKSTKSGEGAHFQCGHWHFAGLLQMMTDPFGSYWSSASGKSINFHWKICLWLNRKKMGQQCRRNRSNTCYLLLQYSETTKSVEQPTNSARDRGAWRPRAKGPCNIRYPHRLRAFLPGTCCVNHNKLTFWMVGDTIPSRS